VLGDEQARNEGGTQGTQKLKNLQNSENLNEKTVLLEILDVRTQTITKRVIRKG
jgi:hypothetical protein